jgi:CheY-like chemotaxis protein
LRTPRLRHHAPRPEYQEVTETKRILVVDDEADIREVAQLALEAVGGFGVTLASCGREALELARAEAPDAILLDVMMPDLDGPSTVALLRQDAATRDIPVVLLTAKVQAADRRRLEALGVAAVMAKPFDPMTLASDVAATLGWT